MYALATTVVFSRFDCAISLMPWTKNWIISGSCRYTKRGVGKWTEGKGESLCAGNQIKFRTTRSIEAGMIKSRMSIYKIMKWVLKMRLAKGTEFLPATMQRARTWRKWTRPTAWSKIGTWLNDKLNNYEKTRSNLEPNIYKSTWLNSSNIRTSVLLQMQKTNTEHVVWNHLRQQELWQIC